MYFKLPYLVDVCVLMHPLQANGYVLQNNGHLMRQSLVLISNA